MRTKGQAASGEQTVVSSAAVADYIRSRLMTGHFVPGQRLVEADIMRETGATRGRVREALQRLAVEGLVVIQEFRGASIKRMTREEVDETYRAREALEGLCARLVAERGSDRALGQLQQLQRDMDECEAESDNVRFPLINERWHELIISASGNGIVGSFLERLRIPIIAVQFRRAFSLQALKKSNIQHRRITDAILAHDGDQAERCMREHIREALDDLAGRGDEFFQR